MTCLHLGSSLWRRIVANGAEHVWARCVSCRAWLAAVPSRDVPDLQSLPLHDGRVPAEPERQRSLFE